MINSNSSFAKFISFLDNSLTISASFLIENEPLLYFEIKLNIFVKYLSNTSLSSMSLIDFRTSEIYLEA